MQEIISKQENKPNPLLKAVYNFGPNNSSVFVQPGAVCNNSQIENSKAPRLYENLRS